MRPMTMMGSTSQGPNSIAAPSHPRPNIELSTYCPPRMPPPLQPRFFPYHPTDMLSSSHYLVDTLTSSEAMLESSSRQHISVATSSHLQTSSGSSPNYLPHMPPPLHVPGTMSSSSYHPTIMSTSPFFPNLPGMPLHSSSGFHPGIVGLGFSHHHTARVSSSRPFTQSSSTGLYVSLQLPTKPDTADSSTEAQGTTEDGKGRGKRRDEEKDFLHGVKMITNKYSPGIYFPPPGGKEKDRVGMMKKGE